MHLARHFWLSHTATRFCLSGGLATALHYSIMLVAIHAGASPSMATTLGAIAGAIANYILQYQFTFQSTKTHATASRRYMVTVIISWVLNLVFFVALSAGLQLHVYFAQLLTTALVALCNYWVCKRHVFR